MSDWYYAVDNEQKGPINESELKANFATNKLPTDTLVWKDGMDNWAPANQVPAFSFRPPPAPAKVQPAPAAVPAPAPVATETPVTSNPDSTTPVNLTSLITAKGEALEVDPEDAEKNKIFGILAYLVFFVPLLAAKDSPYAKYHANQGLVLFLVWISLAIVLWVIGAIFSILPAGLYILFAILNLAYIGPFILLILGVINAAAGKCVPLPFIGGVKLLK
jgi:uncharacterized membrane protein